MTRSYWRKAESRMVRGFLAASLSLVALVASGASRAADWKSIKPARTGEAEVIAQFGAPDEIVATFPWSEWSARWKTRPRTSQYVIRYRSDPAKSDLLRGPGGAADAAEVYLSKGTVVSVTWHYSGPSARAAAATLRADTEIQFSPPESPSYGSKALPDGRLFIEFGSEESSVRVVYDLK
jgi:hypothetical protein